MSATKTFVFKSRDHTLRGETSLNKRPTKDIGNEPVYKDPHRLTIYFTTNRITEAYVQEVNLQSAFLNSPQIMSE